MKNDIIEINPSADHDTMIRVETKLDVLSDDVKDLKSGMISRIVRTEARLDAVDVYHAGISLKTYDDNSKWVTNYRANFKLVIAIILFVASIVSSIIVLALKKFLNY